MPLLPRSIYNVRIMDCTTARVAVFARKQFQLGAVLVSGAIYHTQDCCMMHATVKMCHCFVFFFFFLAGSSLEELYTKSRSPEKKMILEET